jgi:hypothetical protein
MLLSRQSRLLRKHLCDSLLMPKATTLQLAPDFKSRDALDATAVLLQLFGVQPQGPA